MSKPIRLLVVDDDEALREQLATVLAEDYDTATAGDCEGAVAEMERRPADVAILDYRLPGGTGLELFERLLAINANLKAVMISGTPEEVFAAPAFAGLEVKHVLTKPFSGRQLRAALEDLVSAR